MPLTPEDVSNKRFTPVRLREGYDMGEVDQFLDEVEAELARLTKENDDLRAEAVGGPDRRRLQLPGHRVHGADARGPGARPRAPAGPRAQPGPGARGAAGGRRRRARDHPGRDRPQASNAAARLLEIATRNADELVEPAKNEADKIIGEARTKSERLEAESKVKADRLESDARTRAQMLDSETAERRQQMFGELERERDKLNSEVETLRAFEREYRSRLKSYFTQQLEALAGPGGVARGVRRAAAGTQAAALDPG